MKICHERCDFSSRNQNRKKHHLTQKILKIEDYSFPDLFDALLVKLSLEAEEVGHLLGDGVGAARLDVHGDLLQTVRGLLSDLER